MSFGGALKDAPFICSVALAATLVPNVGPSRNKRKHFMAVMVDGGASSGRGTSLEQPKNQQRLYQPGHQLKAPMLQEGDGGLSHVAWWRVATSL